MNNDINNVILNRHIKFVLNSFFSNVFESHEFYNIRCNVCGDSKSDPHAKSAYILKNKDPWVYYCHRADCMTSIKAVNWLKKYFPDNYKKYISDIMRHKNVSDLDNKKYNNIKQKRSIKEIDEKKETSFFKKAVKFGDVVKYCEDRKIPKDVYSGWFYATDGLYKGRIIIPFKKPNGEIYYYQGRKFNNTYGVKYLSRYGDYNNIYNYYGVDQSKPVCILEGPIDSIFVENSIAVTGMKIQDGKLQKFKDKRFILDNDNAANKNAIKLLKRKEYVFIWSKFLKKYKYNGTIKDINDFILNNKENINKITWDMISDCFTDNINDKLYFIGA